MAIRPNAPRRGHRIPRRRLPITQRAFAAILTAAVVAGCGAPQSIAEPAPTAGSYPSMPTDNVSGPFPVVSVADGDTITVTRGGHREKVRLIGIDTPELNDPRTGVECYAQQAATQARAVFDGQAVYLESDPSQAVTDRYGRTLAYVWTTTGRLFNLDMISDGFAHEYTYDTPYRYQALFRAAEAEARAQDRGLWNTSTCPQ